MWMWATGEQIEIAGVESHTLEWYLVWSTVGLGIATVVCALVTGLLAWISWKQFKAENAKSIHATDKAAEVANNSIDSMEHVAVVALTHEDKLRQIRALSRKNKKGLVE